MNETRPCRRALALLMIICCMLTAFLADAQPASAAKDYVTVTSKKPSPYLEDYMHFVRVKRSSGEETIAFCAQARLSAPAIGEKLNLYGPLEIPELDYVLWHGYDGKIVTSLYGLDAVRSETATRAAAWLAIAYQREDLLTYRPQNGEPFHGNDYYLDHWQGISDQKTRDAAWDLYQEGLAYKKKGGGGIEKDCAALWRYPGAQPYQSVITVDKAIETDFEKTSSNGSLTKGNSTYSLKGAKYDIFTAADDKKVASITTDAKGRASCELRPGVKHYAKETKAPAGYKLSTKKTTFTPKMDGSAVKLTDQPGSVSITVAKKDSATNGGPQPGASLAGAQFKLTSVSTPGWERTGTTGKDGSLRFTGIPLGTFHVVETKAPEGYKLDPTVHTYTVKADELDQSGTVTLIPENDYREHVIAFDIEIAKFTDDGEGESEIEKPAEGVAFQIISNTTEKVVGTIKTDKDGHATTKGSWFGLGDRVDGISGALPYDRKGYTVREVAETVPPGYQRVDDWVIDADQMTDGISLKYIVNNSALTTHLQLVKTDAESGLTVPLSGFTFQILDADKKPITQQAWYPEPIKLSKFTTDKHGRVTLPAPLRSGTYYVRETAVQPPYLPLEEDIEFTITNSEADIEPITVVKIPNQQQKGSATIRKTCAADKDALSGAVFQVVAREDIISPDGITHASKGDVVTEVTTDKEGIATAKSLHLGSGSATYAFVEKTPPSGHALDGTPHEFTLTYDNDSAQVSTRVEATDQPTKITVVKTIKGTDKPLAGAVFKVECTSNPDIKSVQDASDKEGNITFDHLVPGTYRMTEVEAPTGYLPNPEPWEFTVDKNGLVQDEGAFEYKIENDFTKVEITKRDITNEEEVIGAKLVIKDADGDVVDEWTSGSAPHRIDALAPGEYTLTEIMTPNDYDQASTVSFTVRDTGEIQAVTMYDRPIKISGSIDKRQEIADPILEGIDADTQTARAAVRKSAEGEFSYTLDARSTSNTWVDEFTVEDPLPGVRDGLVRLQSVTTPQAWEDYDGKLNVWYTTNMPAADKGEQANATRDDGHENPWLDHTSNDDRLGKDGRALEYRGWRLWAKDIDATTSTVLDVSKLKLQAGEFVTGVRFEFGRVEKGFSTRPELWDRSDLKHERDDMDRAPKEHETSFKGDGDGTAFAPITLTMRVTDAYDTETELVNKAEVHLFRNGGGKGLEDHDRDRVVQKPGPGILAQTGTFALGGLGIIAIGFSWMAWLLRKKR